MALINNLWVHITDEQVTREVKATEHTTEQGLPLTDNVKRQPVTASLTGEIVDYGDNKSHEILAKLYDLQIKGSLITYSGRNILKNMIIESFDTTHPNTNAGGLNFAMKLKEIRIAQNAYNASTEADKTKAEDKAGTQQVQNGTGNAVYHTVKSGDSPWRLANVNYKEYGHTAQWILDNNSNCFSKKGDPTTLIVGSKVLVGYKDSNKTKS